MSICFLRSKDWIRWKNENSGRTKHFWVRLAKVYFMLSNANLDAHIMVYFVLLFRLNNPLLSHESRLQPKVNPSSVSGNDLMPHTADVKNKINK